MTEPDQAQSGPRDDPADNARRRRLLFRATHRGTFENDLLIGGFVRRHLNTLSEADIEALEALLERPDPDLADWLTGRRPIAPEDATPMLLRIRASVER
jgi:antitoxin CptB